MASESRWLHNMDGKHSNEQNEERRFENGSNGSHYFDERGPCTYAMGNDDAQCQGSCSGQGGNDGHWGVEKSRVFHGEQRPRGFHGVGNIEAPRAADGFQEQMK